MSGGGNRATYRLSLGYATDDGTTIGTSMNRFNSTLRIDYNFSKKLRFGANVTYTQTDKDATGLPPFVLKPLKRCLISHLM